MLNISKQNEATIIKLIKDKQPTAKVKGAVHVYNEGTATDNEVREYLKGKGYTVIRASNFRGDLYAILGDRHLNTKDFDALIEQATENTRKNIGHFNAIRLLANKVRSQAVALKGGK